jgi:hypothetical protein
MLRLTIIDNIINFNFNFDFNVHDDYNVNDYLECIIYY